MRPAAAHRRGIIALIVSVATAAAAAALIFGLPILMSSILLRRTATTNPLTTHPLRSLTTIPSSSTIATGATRLLRAANKSAATTTTRTPHRKMHIQSIPMWEGSGNNYAYLVTDEGTKDATIIDPANPPEVLPVLKDKVGSGAINLKNIINTHHHGDHAGGNVETLKHYKVPVIGGKDCAAVSSTPAHNSTFKLGSGITVTALHTPCHTQDSICYLFEDEAKSERAVFTGDTLFIGGCGRFFEGTPAEMDTALNKVLAGLPDDTKVYPGHEYTKGNVKFGAAVLPDDAAVQSLAKFAAENRETQGKFTMGDEKRHNVFMRLGDAGVRRAAGFDGAGGGDDAAVMGKLREMKNGM